MRAFWFLGKGKSRRRGHQVADIPLRRAADGGLEVLLITSRSTGRWIVPKGWPMRGRADHDAAAVEAREEAGQVGHVLADPIGDYRYWRRTRRHFRLTKVTAYALAVTGQDTDWKERCERAQRWFDVTSAVEFVEEPELATLLLAVPQVDRLTELLLNR